MIKPKKNILWVLVVLFITLKNNVFSQDVQFSQYYNLIQYQNPAFVGTSLAWRATLHSRIQWPGLDARYTTGVAAVDYNLSQYNSGIGMMFLADDQGSSVKTFKGIAEYSYQVVLTQDAILRAGVNAGFVNRQFTNSSLYYPEQFNGSGFNSQGNIPEVSVNYLDLTGGLLFYTNNFWLGLSGAHLNRPNQSLTGAIDRIPVKYDLLTGVKINIRSYQTMRYLNDTDDDMWALYPTILYKWQGKFDQMDVGLYTIYNIFKLGLWYRGVPIKRDESNSLNSESIIVLAGIKIHNISFSYSYDFGISQLGPYSRGSHELNLTFLYPKNKKKEQKYKTLPCPEFYGF